MVTGIALPDVFILMLIGTLPDYIQGVAKLILWQTAKPPSKR